MTTAQQQAEALAAGLYAHQVEGIAFLLGRQPFAHFARSHWREQTYRSVAVWLPGTVTVAKGATVTVELVANNADKDEPI